MPSETYPTSSQQLVTVSNGSHTRKEDGQFEGSMTALDVRAQVNRIQEVMRAVMQEGLHYGVIPGTDKPTLLKPGAEKLTMTFRLAPMLDVELREFPNGHREYQVKCRLVHILTGQCYGEGVGSCSTMESRYRYRQAARSCPSCGNETIIKGKTEYGGGWLCFQKKGGCGAKFSDQDPEITSQPTGRTENPDISDTHNTVLKMAKKRALVDATLTATAASDIFTQDLEDFAPDEPVSRNPMPPPARPLSEGVREEVKPLRTEPQAETGAADKISQPQVVMLIQHCRDCGVTEGALKVHLQRTYGSDSRKDIAVDKLDEVMTWVAAQAEGGEVT